MKIIAINGLAFLLLDYLNRLLSIWKLFAIVPVNELIIT